MRKSVAKFIEERDGYAANPDNIFLTDGASPAVQVVHATVLVHCLCPVSSHTHTCPALLSLSLVSIQRILMSLIRDHNDSIMIPIPQVCVSTLTPPYLPAHPCCCCCTVPSVHWHYRLVWRLLWQLLPGRD